MQTHAEGGTARDPVCGMVLLHRHTNLVSEYLGRKYYFCCSGCKGSFERDHGDLPEGICSGFDLSDRIWKPVSHEWQFQE
ncbi:MAG: YHS domain-containing protein [Dehalococcoidia bacterium]|nr:YHS domain-containing protein [Dehalococcoidia bacterium]